MQNSLLLTWGVIALIGYFTYRYAFSRKSPRNFPPGPNPLPFVGNIRDFPPAGVPEFQHWLQHKDLYGPISSVTVLGMTVVFIHDKKIAHHLLEQAANKTSGRPTMVFANKMCGYESIILCQGYNTTFRHYRKLLHRELGTKVSAAQFQNAQEVEVNRQLVRSLDEPRKWLQNLKTTAGATVLKMAYGYTVEHDKPDVLVDLIEKTMTEFSLAAVPLAWPVDLIPILQYLPESFPGAAFKKTAREWKRSIQAAAHIPYRFVRRQMASNTYHRSYVSKLIQQYEPEDGLANLSREDEEAIVWTAAALYGAASDTTTITLTAFTKAMVLFPEVQRKAQEEIDRIVGTDRLPNFEDRDKLPYINALVKEALRWWPVAPMGFPHTADEDIEYNGLHIPKGAYLLPAVWWFLHDPEVYADPDSFDPERFLNPRNEPDPSSETFGYGRRICPGRFFADSKLYINIVQSLATFNFNKMLGEDGKEVGINIKAKPGILSYPSNFQFQVAPRSPQHVDLIRHLEKEIPPAQRDTELIEVMMNST